MTSILDRTGKTPDTLGEYGGNASASGTGPSAQVPADWDASTGISRILNKPNIGEVAVDAVAAALAAGSHSGISFAYDDAGNKISATVNGVSAPGASATNLSIVARGATTLDIASDTGTDATVPAATPALAGLMSAADKTKLDGLSGAAGGAAPVYRKANVVANGVTGFIVLTGFGTQAQLDAATVTPSADGATITVAALAAGFVLASVSAHLPDGFTSASTSAFSFVLPANFGVSALDSLPIVDLVRFNAAGMRQAQTNIGVSVTGTAVTVTQTGLTGGVAARFKATAL